MERAVQVQLLALFEANKVLSVYQSGFRKKHSTETAVVHLVDHILEHMDKKQLTGAAFIDLAVIGSLGWFTNYLIIRSQRVQYGKELSSSKLILNQSKTKGLLFGTRQLLQTTSDFVLHIQSKDIERHYL